MAIGVNDVMPPGWSMFTNPTTYMSDPLALQNVYPQGYASHMGNAMQNAFWVDLDRAARRQLSEGIAAGALPDWPAWSALMAGEPL